MKPLLTQHHTHAITRMVYGTTRRKVIKYLECRLTKKSLSRGTRLLFSATRPWGQNFVSCATSRPPDGLFRSDLKWSTGVAVDVSLPSVSRPSMFSDTMVTGRRPRLTILTRIGKVHRASGARPNVSPGHAPLFGTDVNWGTSCVGLFQRKDSREPTLHRPVFWRSRKTKFDTRYGSLPGCLSNMAANWPHHVNSLLEGFTLLLDSFQVRSPPLLPSFHLSISL